MTLPKEAELLGANSHELPIGGSGAHTIVELHGDDQRNLLARLAHTTAETSPRRVYLALENIRGTQDASVLNVYLNLPEDAPPGGHRHLLAGSVGLYGLRRASIQHGENSGQGLAFVFDITRILLELLAAQSLDPGEIRISILPHRPLPDRTDIVVGRVAIFATSPK